MKILVLFIVFCLCHFSYLHANEVELTSQQEADYQEITRSLRCLTCEAQSVFESDTAMAIAVKNYVKESLSHHQSAEEIENFLRERYGETIFFEPKGSFLSSALWIAPVILFMSGAVWVIISHRRRVL